MVEHDGESPFVICDYGAADGRTTHAVMDACIGYEVPAELTIHMALGRGHLRRQGFSFTQQSLGRSCGEIWY